MPSTHIVHCILNIFLAQRHMQTHVNINVLPLPLPCIQEYDVYTIWRLWTERNDFWNIPFWAYFSWALGVIFDFIKSRYLSIFIGLRLCCASFPFIKYYCIIVFKTNISGMDRNEEWFMLFRRLYRFVCLVFVFVPKKNLDYCLIYIGYWISCTHWKWKAHTHQTMMHTPKRWDETSLK